MKSFFLASFICCLSIGVLAQSDHSNHQPQATTKPEVKPGLNTKINGKPGQEDQSQILPAYFSIKNALVKGDAGAAASNSNRFLESINSTDITGISKDKFNALARDAAKIAGTKNLEKQRAYFASLSSGMATVAKALKAGNEPVYLQYCPMKKASWLSSEASIKNPYYGNSMLTCGELTETL